MIFLFILIVFLGSLKEICNKVASALAQKARTPVGFYVQFGFRIPNENITQIINKITTAFIKKKERKKKGDIYKKPL